MTPFIRFCRLLETGILAAAAAWPPAPPVHAAPAAPVVPRSFDPPAV
jgi:hypothetical protein